MEVMGLMLGEFVDDYTIRVADVFAMPQVRREKFFFLLRSMGAKKREKKNLDPPLNNTSPLTHYSDPS